MFSQKTLSVLLVIAIILISFQTYSLFRLDRKIKEAKLNFGTAPTVTLSESGGAPDMVGGC